MLSSDIYTSVVLRHQMAVWADLMFFYTTYLSREVSASMDTLHRSDVEFTDHSYTQFKDFATLMNDSFSVPHISRENVPCKRQANFF